MDKEINDVDKYYKKKAYYSNLKKNQVTKIRKNTLLTKPEKKEKAKKIRLPCIFCKKLIGTIFEKKDNHLIARCGGESSGCGNTINIQLYAHTSSENIKKIFLNDINELKENIIKLKCSTLFQYVSKEQAITEFEKINNELSVNSVIYLHILRKYNDHSSNINYVDDELEDFIKEYKDNVSKIKDYFEKYKTEQLQSYLNEIVSIYKDIIKPLNVQIRDKKYKNMEVIIENDDGIYTHKLKYNTHTPADIEEFYDIEDEYNSSSSNPLPKITVEAPKVSVNVPKDLMEDKTKIIVKDNNIYLDGKIILNKRNYTANVKLLESVDEITSLEANNKKYKFEMIYTSEKIPILVCIDPENGNIYKVK
jgi:hypothetical protein